MHALLNIEQHLSICAGMLGREGDFSGSMTAMAQAAVCRRWRMWVVNVYKILALFGVDDAYKAALNERSRM